jgi:uroporphyrin-III C-methyltransferase/precorrin-2 dehydrogenase/sirohydrochlorin ferrochelatase
MNLPWSELAVEQQTIVFYMALKGAAHLSEQLQTHGMRGDMPVALVEKGTQLDLRTIKDQGLFRVLRHQTSLAFL